MNNYTRIVQEGMTAWENEERSNVEKYFKMHYENARRFEEYGNRMRQYEHLEKLLHDIQVQKSDIEYQEQQARADLNEINKELKRRYMTEWEKNQVTNFLQ